MNTRSRPCGNRSCGILSPSWRGRRHCSITGCSATIHPSQIRPLHARRCRVATDNIMFRLLGKQSPASCSRYQVRQRFQRRDSARVPGVMPARQIGAVSALPGRGNNVGGSYLVRPSYVKTAPSDSPVLACARTSGEMMIKLPISAPAAGQAGRSNESAAIPSSHSPRVAQFSAPASTPSPPSDYRGKHQRRFRRWRQDICGAAISGNQ